MQSKKDRIIIDTNLWLSFLISHDYPWLDSLFADNNIVLLFSNELIDEFIEVAQRPKFKKYFSLSDFQSLLRQMSSKCEFIPVISKVKLCRDPKDDFLLSLAKDGRATHLISGDKDLLDMTHFENTKILTIRDYLGTIAK